MGLLASAGNTGVPIGTIVAVITGIAAFASLFWAVNSNRALKRSGLAGGVQAPVPSVGQTAARSSGSKAFWRGNSAKSVAEMAANAAIALQTRVEQLESEKVAAKAERDAEKTEWRAEMNAMKVTIEHLQADNDRLQRLVTLADWGKDLIQKLDDDHKELLSAIKGQAT